MHLEVCLFYNSAKCQLTFTYYLLLLYFTCVYFKHLLEKHSSCRNQHISPNTVILRPIVTYWSLLLLIEFPRLISSKHRLTATHAESVSEIIIWGMNIGQFVLMEVRCAVCMFMLHYCNISDYRPLGFRLLVFNS